MLGAPTQYFERLSHSLRGELVYFILQEAERAGMTPLPEIELQQIIRHTQETKVKTRSLQPDIPPFDFRSHGCPVALNEGFVNFMDTLDRRFVDILIKRDDRVPSRGFKYYLSSQGAKHAGGFQTGIERLKPGLAERVRTEAGRRARFQQRSDLVMLSEGFETLNEFLYYVTHNYGSDVSESVDCVTRELVEQNKPANPLHILDEIMRQTQRIDVARMGLQVRFRSEDPAMAVG